MGIMLYGAADEHVGGGMSSAEFSDGGTRGVILERGSAFDIGLKAGEVKFCIVKKILGKG
ncbi:hypothetical protein ACLEDK_02310 [Lonsdalea quercina]|uniref:hypothetical protein n=1 Tax=Lonsdalea quercina TaxID=71657 RepID=UPI0039762658